MKKFLKRLFVFLFIFVITMSTSGCTLLGVSETSVPKQKTPVTITESDFEPDYEDCPTYEEVYAETGSATEACLTSSRPWNAYYFPDSTDEATSIRISFITRDIDGSLFLENPTLTNKQKKNAKFCQLYYGYYSNGQWYDMPAENYEIKGIGSNEYSELRREHLVVFGDYVLISLPVGDDERQTATVTDTLGSEIVCFDDYSKRASHFNGDETIYHIIEDIEIEGNYGRLNDYNCIYSSIWRFILVKLDDITEDYAITVSNDWNALEYTYTYDDIMVALNRE